MPLNEAQIAALLKPIKPHRVMSANGQSHVPAYDVAAHLTRIFGFGNWDTELLSKELLFEDGGAERKRWTVGYSATVRLTVKDSYGEIAHWENGACGDAVNQPSRADAHHLAMTTAISTALKRCAAFGLGDQFGLSLYNKGSMSALIGLTLVGGPSEGAPAAPDLEKHIEKPLSLGNDEMEPRTSGEPVVTEDDQKPRAPMSDMQRRIREHPDYEAIEPAYRATFISDHVGYTVSSLRDLSDEDCEQVLAELRTIELRRLA